MAETKKGWEFITDAFLKRGVEYLFSLPGEPISPIHRAVEGTSIKIITTRHEQAAAFMAEAYGRMTRRAGIAVVTFGPGFTNALSAIQNANLSNSPVILIAGAHGSASPDRLGLQDMRQEPIIESIVKKSFVCKRAERIPEYIDMAFRYAEGGRPGPVFLEMPIDVLDADVNPNAVGNFQTTVKSRPVDPVDVKAMMEMINDSEKPVIMAGSGAYFSDAGKELGTFAEKAGIPVFTAKFARGVVPDTHPMCFESSVVFRPGCSGMATTASDCIILLGNRLCLFNANGRLYRKDAKIIQVDIEPEEIGRNRSVDLGIFADISRLLDECNRWIEKENAGDSLKNKFSGWVEELRKNHSAGRDFSKIDTESQKLPINPGRLAHEIDLFMNKEDDIVIADGGDTVTWIHAYRTCVRPWSEMSSGLYGCLGSGIPYANAAKLVHSESRVLLCIGDGSMGFNFMEILTLLNQNLPIVIVIGNNNLWGMTANGMKLKYKRLIPGTVELDFIPYEKLMEELGVKGFLVEKPEDIQPTLKEAFDFGKTAIINVKTDPDIMGPGSVAMAMIQAKEF